MEPIATYDELTAMDDATFVKRTKDNMIAEAKKIKDDAAKSAIILSREAELKTFDEDAKNQIANLQTTISTARTVIEKKYADQLAAVEMTAEKVI
jgi:hypothetical protein